MIHGKLTFKNYLLNPFVEFLSVPLTGQTARTRNRFIVLLSEQAQKNEAERKGLLEEFGEKGEDGKLVLTEDGMNFKLKDADEFNKQFGLLNQRTFDIECKNEQFVDFRTVFSVLSALETPLNVQQTRFYDEIMTEFERWNKEESEKGAKEEKNEGAK